MLTVAFAAPSSASAGLDDVVNQVRDTVNGVAGSLGGGGGGGGGSPSAQPTPQAGTPPNYTPPAHGTNPHGEGTGAVIDLVPESSEPLEEDDSSEDVVVGRSRGDQDADGSYHGKITIISLLGLSVPGLEPIETDEGDPTNDGPFGGLNTALGTLCTDSGNQLCLQIFAMNSTTDENGSQNSFTVVDANVGEEGSVISASALSSEGNIREFNTDNHGRCQESEGKSDVANAAVLGAVTASAFESSSTSRACQDGTERQTNESDGLNVLGTALPLPTAGCENGTPNTPFNPVLVGLIVSAVCHADDSNADQMDDPYGVREALSVFVLPIVGEGGLAKGTTAAGESHAVAPDDDGPVCPDPSNPDCPEPPECPDPDNPDCPGPDGPDGPGKGPGPDGPDGPSADDPDDAALPFTGADMLALLLTGGGVMGVGLALMALADRRRRSRA